MVTKRVYLATLISLSYLFAPIGRWTAGRGELDPEGELDTHGEAVVKSLVYLWVEARFCIFFSVFE
jgi:hypothetical protein